MAHLAFKMGVLGVILIGWTIFETRNASNASMNALKIAGQTLEQSKSATEAAWKNVEDAREIGTKQTRAYVSIESVKIAYSLPLIDLSIVLKNYGVSPVIRGEISGELELVLLPYSVKDGSDDLIVKIPYLAVTPFAVIEAGGSTTVGVTVDHLHIGWREHSPLDEPTRLRIIEQFASPRTQQRFRINVQWTDVFGGVQHLRATASNMSPGLGHDIIANNGQVARLNTNIHSYDEG